MFNKLLKETEKIGQEQLGLQIAEAFKGKKADKKEEELKKAGWKRSKDGKGEYRYKYTKDGEKVVWRINYRDESGEVCLHKDQLSEEIMFNKLLKEGVESSFDEMIQPLLKKYGLTSSNFYPEADYELDGDYYMLLTVDGKASDILRFMDDPDVEVLFGDDDEARQEALRGSLISAGDDLVSGVDIGIYYQYDMDSED